jgi:hypothetical protein
MQLSAIYTLVLLSFIVSSCLIQIEQCVAGFPSQGIRDTATGLLVSWSITYDYGAIGMTYTDPVSTLAVHSAFVIFHYFVFIISVPAVRTCVLVITNYLTHTHKVTYNALI